MHAHFSEDRCPVDGYGSYYCRYFISIFFLSAFYGEQSVLSDHMSISKIRIMSRQNL